MNVSKHLKDISRDQSEKYQELYNTFENVYIMERKFKQWWSTILTIRTIISHLKSLNIKQTTTYDVGNQSPGVRQAHKCVSWPTIFLVMLLEIFRKIQKT